MKCMNPGVIIIALCRTVHGFVPSAHHTFTELWGLEGLQSSIQLELLQSNHNGLDAQQTSLNGTLEIRAFLCGCI